MRKHLLLLAAILLPAFSFGQRIDTATPSDSMVAVDEYCPAPGQFINTLPQYEAGDDAKTMAEKCTKALRSNSIICLGGWGGYATFHFDHSIANIKGQRDIYIGGNSFTNSSEPGIVMVSKDVNHNGIADDPWYEIAGSGDRDSLSKMVFGYEVTYTIDSMKDVPWTDNRGNSGTIDRNSFHTQEYFPLWLSSPLTFKGTLLPTNAENTGGSYWALHSYAYGYVDNAASRWDEDANSYDIDWAVDPLTRDSVHLDFVDFVRVYTGVNQKAGWLGETSTEISGCPRDRHLQASVNAIHDALNTVTFDDIALDADTLLAMDGDDPQFESKGFTFNYNWFPEYSYWSGFRVTGKKDTSFADYRDQYNSCLGHGYANSANYCVVYPQGENIDVTDGSAKTVSGFYVAANRYLEDAILNGDGMTPGAFSKGDWYRLDIIGLNGEEKKDTISYYLADYRSENEADHYYVRDWTWLDLSKLGDVTGLTFRLSSSRNNAYGMTTPGYFLMDNFNGVYDGTSDKLTAIDGTATAISSPRTATANANDSDAIIYNLAGQRVGKDYKGIVIVNGRKVLRK